MAEKEINVIGNPINMLELLDMIGRMQKRMDEGQTFSEAAAPEIASNLSGKDQDFLNSTTGR